MKLLRTLVAIACFLGGIGICYWALTSYIKLGDLAASRFSIEYSNAGVGIVFVLIGAVLALDGLLYLLRRIQEWGGEGHDEP